MQNKFLQRFILIKNELFERHLLLGTNIWLAERLVYSGDALRAPLLANFITLRIKNSSVECVYRAVGFVYLGY